MKLIKEFNYTLYFERLITAIIMVTVVTGILTPWSVDTKTQAVLAQVFSQEKNSFPISGEREPSYTKWVVSTAYSSDPWQTDSTPCYPAMDFNLCAHYEKNGLEDTIAANFLSLGTQVKFPDLYGDKVFVVRDRMNARYNGTNRVDIWIGSVTPENQEIIRAAKAKAISFGVKSLKMEIY